MANSETIKLIIDDVIPNAGDNETQWIVSAWQGLHKSLQKVPFQVEDPYRAELDEFTISVDASPVVDLLKSAAESSGGFASYLQLAVEKDLPIGAEITMVFESDIENMEKYTRYHAAAVLVQQIMLAMNICLPGSCQFLEVYFEGDQAELFDLPELDSTVFTNGWLSAFDADWPVLKPLKFSDVWEWLTAQATSETDTAIRPINKVLFGLLELCQPRSMFEARDALLMTHILEILMDTGNMTSPDLIRERVVSILGEPDLKADSFNELYRLKNAMIRGDLPSRRPALVFHDADEEILQQLEVHNSPIEQALAALLGMLQDLVLNNAKGYKFSEQMARL